MTPKVSEMLRQAHEAHHHGQIDRAADLCRAILGESPHEFEALLLLGILAAKTSRHAISVRALTEVLEQDPDVFDALVWLGIVEHQLGEFDTARKRFEHAHNLKPEAIAPYVGILRGHKMKEADRPMISEAVAVLANVTEVDDETRQLNYGLAKAFNDLGEYEVAIGYYDRANEIAAKLQKPQGFDRKLHSRKLDEMIHVFNRGLLTHKDRLGSTSRKPIFILGMIRSGTTLTEQIVSRHPSVAAGGEIRYWIDNGPAALNPGARTFNRELGGFLALEYLSALGRLAPGFPHVSDKMPLNYMLAGMIHLLFPEAPIIHCRRNPVDTCLSIFMTPYAAPPDFAYNRDDIAFAYREYQRVMQHWREAMPPDRMFEVDYESLVSDPEPNIRALIGYCGLDWDPACLTPEKNERAVDTPSRWQVRQPVYRSSVGRARHYAPWLGAIGELA